MYKTTITISFESLVQDYKRVFTQCSVSADCNGFSGLRADQMRPRIFPRERLVCFRYNTKDLVGFIFHNHAYATQFAQGSYDINI